MGPVVFPFTGKSVGGSHISTFLLADSLTRDFGIKAIILAVEDTSIIAEARRRGLEVRVIPAPHKRRRIEIRDLTQFFSRRKMLAGWGKRAIVHCSDIWSLYSFAPAGKSLGLPVIYHNRKLVRGDLYDRAAIRMAEAVISISDACRQRLRGVEPEKITIILNPFKDSRILSDRAAARAEFESLWPVEGLRIIGSSGNFAYSKRADFFIEAAAAVARHDEQARFILFGGERDQSVEQLASLAHSLNIEDRVLFAGFRSPPEQNLIALDVLAVPALSEAFGRTLVEAILLGIPYVATDDGGHSEIGRRWGGGTLVPREADAEQFGAAIRELLEQGSTASLNLDRRTAVAGEFHPAKHAGRVIEIYKRLLEVKDGH